MNNKQRGFTLLEVIIALAISGIICTGITMAVVQIVNFNAASRNHIQAVKQVESATFWINRDTRMAQTIQPGGSSGFPLTLNWTEWNNTTRDVTYTIDNGRLTRSLSTNEEPPVQTVIARDIDNDDDKTNCQYANSVFTFKLTASVGRFRPDSETRFAQVIPRTEQ